MALGYTASPYTNKKSSGNGHSSHHKLQQGRQQDKSHSKLQQNKLQDTGHTANCTGQTTGYRSHNKLYRTDNRILTGTGLQQTTFSANHTATTQSSHAHR
ncbi:hypothetical protein GDO78_005328 [Eleutherodactylus coqui]|uniref:Uncharacterized protein n=1 Tax=Eleutherodactylus coqui TaxID=57060 RepID=A0A8J6FJZ3_ELECQ|nr:hypothetical protein GDO78_005328 [Eleutherodactylus coqui]